MKKKKSPSHFLKMRVLGAIDSAEGESFRDRIKKVSEMTFEDEQGRPCKFTWRTIETWRTKFRKHGIAGIMSMERSDKGKDRKVHMEVLEEAIDQVLPLLNGKSYSLSQIYRKCIEKGLLQKDEIAFTTFCRKVKKHELLKSKIMAKKRLAFSKKFANEMWQGDTMYGPYSKDDKGHSRKTFLIALLDDASRVVVHGQFFFSDSTESLIETLRSGFYKRGIPKQIYVDNGAAYCSKELNVICARLETYLSHAPVRDGAAKGKIERFFRTVRMKFLSLKLDLSSLEKLNKQFIWWLEEQYNGQIHSAIGMKPIDRFGIDLKRIQFLSPNEDNDQLFFFEDNRKVKKDNTFSLKNIRYEAPRDLRGRTIQVRYNRANLEKVFVYYKEENMGHAKKLDLIYNDRKPSLLKGKQS